MYKRAAILLLLTTALHAQQQRTVHDAQDHLTFQVPATWSLATRDKELSTFHHEGRTAPLTARVRYVAAIAENPFPASNFSGAHFYISATPDQTPGQCAAQATRSIKDEPHHYRPIPVAPNASIVSVGGHPATHGHDESGRVCTEFRDEIYTIRAGSACLRFDLAMNNFCGGDVSGVRDMTPTEIIDMRTRLETILQSVRFDK
jgi:hypothetical protein